MANECANFCDDIEEQCLTACDGDSFCDFDCRVDGADCTYHCPCYTGCPTGCRGCTSAFCKCIDYESSPDFLACEKHYEDIYTACIVSCDAGDFRCLATCTRDLDQSLLDCPCQSNCPNGCPCEKYECPQTTTAITTTTASITSSTTSMTPSTSVLILNTATNLNVPVITDSTGRVDTNFSFSFEEGTSVYKSCSIVFKNHHYVYGGSGDFIRQISVIDDCKLKRFGYLPFDHYYAACTAVGNNRIYLCFNADWEGDDYGDRKKCRYAPHPGGPFSDDLIGNYDHPYIRIAASSSNITYSRVIFKPFQLKYWPWLVIKLNVNPKVCNWRTTPGIK